MSFGLGSLKRKGAKVQGRHAVFEWAARARNGMKVAAYNIRKGGSPRVHWSRMIEEHGVDLLLLQESYSPDEHLSSKQLIASRQRCVWEPVERSRWGSAIYSSSGTVRAVTVPNFGGWVVGAEICGATWQDPIDDPLLVFSVHAPPPGGSYVKQVNRLLDEIGRVAVGRDTLIGGDFNIGVSHWSRTTRPAGKGDLGVQARLRDEFGLVNCWQEANPDREPAQTLRWTTNPVTPYHCDGLFVPKSWRERLQSCEVLAGDEWNRLSDHNPVVACFS